VVQTASHESGPGNPDGILHRVRSRHGVTLNTKNLTIDKKADFFKPLKE
jgi:hypothetical protein